MWPFEVSKHLNSWKKPIGIVITWYNGKHMSAIHRICNWGSSCCLSRSISAWGWIFNSNLSLSPCSINSSVTSLAARCCTCHCFVDAAKSEDVISIAISKYRCESSSQLYSLDSIKRKNLFLSLKPSVTLGFEQMVLTLWMLCIWI